MSDTHRRSLDRARGRDGWRIQCACGRVFDGWRWLVEERYGDHVVEESNVEITLKNLKVKANLSEETLAFTASVYVNGKKAGNVSNPGNGGPCIVAFNDRALGQRVEEWAAALPADVTGEYGPIPMNLDFYVHGLACRMNRERILRRLCRTRTVGRMADDPPGEIREWTAPYTPIFAAKLRAHFGPQLAEIINERFI